MKIAALVAKLTATKPLNRAQTGSPPSWEIGRLIMWVRRCTKKQHLLQIWRKRRNRRTKVQKWIWTTAISRPCSSSTNKPQRRSALRALCLVPQWSTRWTTRRWWSWKRSNTSYCRSTKTSCARRLLIKLLKPSTKWRLVAGRAKLPSRKRVVPTNKLRGLRAQRGCLLPKRSLKWLQFRNAFQLWVRILQSVS